MDGVIDILNVFVFISYCDEDFVVSYCLTQRKVVLLKLGLSLEDLFFPFYHLNPFPNPSGILGLHSSEAFNNMSRYQRNGTVFWEKRTWILISKVLYSLWLMDVLFNYSDLFFLFIKWLYKDVGRNKCMKVFCT